MPSSTPSRTASRRSAVIHRAFWGACHCGQRAAGRRLLLAHGADLQLAARLGAGHAPRRARRNGFEELAQWLAGLRRNAGRRSAAPRD
jgi:hypothetical protein